MIKTLEAEKAVLGSLILETTWHWYIPKLRVEYFTTIQNKALFSLIHELFVAGSGIDHTTVTIGCLKKNIDVTIVSEYTNSIAQTSNFEHYVFAIKDTHIASVIKKTGANIVEHSEDVDDAVATLDAAYNEVNNTIADGADDRSWDSILDESMNELEQREKRAKLNQINGVESGSRELDKVTNGWQNGDLIILAGRPSMGKTAIALNLAKYSKTETLVFSLEMKDVRLADRMLIAESGVEAYKYRSGFINSDDWRNIEDGAGRLSKLPLKIDQKSGASLGYIRAKIMRAKPKLVIIDYLQLMYVKGYDKNSEYGAVVKGLKAIAMQADIPIILLCQLNRAAEDNAGGVPSLRNLRDSGEIEQDADLVIFVYRPKYYKIQSVMHHNNEIMANNILMLLIAKHRNGPLQDIVLTHNESLTKFSDYKENTSPF